MTSIADVGTSSQDRRVQAQLNALARRTLLTAAALVGSVIGGWWLLSEPLGRFASDLYALLLGQAGLPPAHVPLTGSVDESALRLLSQLALCALTAAALMGQSVGVFGRLSMRWVMVPPLAVGLAMAVVAPPTDGWLQVLPSRLERDITHGRFDAADEALTRASLSPEVSLYVKAQIALRAKDAEALREHGEPVLRLADAFVYGRGAEVAVHFRPGVVHALDLALNGQPQTEVGLRVQQEGLLDRGSAWLLGVFRALLGGAMLVAAWPLLQTWNRMRRRVVRIQHAGEQEAQVSASRTALVVPRGIRRRSAWFAGIAAAVVVVVAVVRSVSAPPAVATVAAIDPTSCRYVGVWTAARDRSVFKVWLNADGRFVAEPIARGPHDGGKITGRWSVTAGPSLAWTYDVGLFAAAPTDDVNRIVDASARSFTLVEVNGERTRYNFAGDLPGKCEGNQRSKRAGARAS